MLKQNITK